MEILLEYEFMRLEKEGKLALVTFTRERYLNAMNNACTVQINDIADGVEGRPGHAGDHHPG